MATELTIPLRDEVVRKYLRSCSIRNPDADIKEGTQPYLDAVTFADQMMMAYENARRIYANTSTKDATGDALDEIGELRGVTRRPAAGASGYVEIRAGVAGTHILYGTECKDNATGSRYQCILQGTYANGAHVPVAGADTGPSTDVAADTVLQWTSPPAGLAAACTVVEQSDGSGLSGGRDAEDDDTYRLRIDDVKANQPASGNDSAYQLEGFETPDVMVEQVFTIPATLGTGTIGLTCTLRPSRLGASRIPNATQLAALLTQVMGQMPADDNVFIMTLVESARNVALEMAWTDESAGWANISPWPAYYAVAPVAGSGQIRVQSATDALNFVLEAANADYTTCGDPVAGTVLGFYDRTYGVFRRKEIQSVVGGGPWTIVCETANGVSDTSYTPIVTQPCCPWSDNLDDVATAVRSYFASLGPGEQQASFTDTGRREKRSPASPRYWPSEVTEAGIAQYVLPLACRHNVNLLEGDGVTAVGTPGTSLYLLHLGYLTCFAE